MSRANTCDLDRDGDGRDNDDDNCPDAPNAAGAPPPTPSADGFIRSWIAAGPYTGTATTKLCRPSDDNLVAKGDAAAGLRRQSKSPRENRRQATASAAPPTASGYSSP